MTKLLTLCALLLTHSALCAEKENGVLLSLYGYFGLDWCPFGNVQLLKVKPGFVHFKTATQEIEYSGRFSIQQPALKREKKWWQFSNGPVSEKASLVILYDYLTMPQMYFYNADVFEAKENYIVFEATSQRFTHCGRYVIQK